EIISSSLISPKEIVLEFSEKCDTTTLLNTSFYTITPNLGQPDVVVVESNNQRIVHLKYLSAQMENIQYLLSVSNIEDVCGNVMENTEIYFQDSVKPELQEVNSISTNQLLLQFSEPMDTVSTLNTANYTVNNGIGVPANAEFEAGSPATVILTLATAIDNNIEYSLQYQNMEDLFGNVIESGSLNFANVVVEPYEIVINEIMADPTPAVGLPEHEYLEIYNTRDLPVNLSGWTLVVGGSIKEFPAVSIEADDQLILCKYDAVPEFEVLGKTAGMDFSNFILTNSGTTIKLFNADSVLIDEVSYTDEWYQDPDKDDGGWSIERIDPWNTCSGMYNWAASINPDGGTPGSTNSIFGQNQDTFAPELVSWELPSANEIKLVFSEVTDTTTSLNADNYYLSPDFGEPSVVTTDEDNPRAVRLQYLSGFEENTLYTLNISNIADACGNVMEETEITFINYEANTFDVLITEIMADPSPPVFLPEAEYLELYNQSPYPINLADWKLISGTSEYDLPAVEIPVDGYLCVAKSTNAPEFSDIPNTAFAESFPLLPNTSGELQLISKEGNLIHFVNYTSEWYGDPTKEDGGWSLEMVDTDNPCGENDNWRASVSETGGTPGEENSVANSNPDSDIPEIDRVIIQEPDSLIVLFDEILHPDFIPDPAKYHVDNGIGDAVFTGRMSGKPHGLLLAFEQEFEPATVYTLQVSDTVIDCAGNKISVTVEKEFALADSVVEGDVVINEILFNPPDGAEDYVELYNRSGKFIDLYDLRMATRDDSLRVDGLEMITDVGFLLFPGDYVVLSENIAAVENNYYCKYPDQLLQVEDLPTYKNSEGDVVLCIPNKEVIDEVVYNEDMHFKLLRSVKGVSLERIDYNEPASDENNWHSAAESVGFGTPTYQNSQYKSSETAESMFELSPETISPDNDGYEDVLTISYKMDKPGYVLSISIYNSKGQPVRNLIDNEMLGSEGQFTWDGLNDDGMHPGSGIYIVLLDYFDLDGNRHQEKKTTVIAVKR
ncbi:MAG: lamin tail domain-containing protein, partial [Bacteroidota bacterium]